EVAYFCRFRLPGLMFTLGEKARQHDTVLAVILRAFPEALNETMDMLRVGHKDLKTSPIQRVRQRFVIDARSLHHQPNVTNTGLAIIQRPLNQRRKAISVIRKNLGFDLHRLAISQPAYVQLVLAYIYPKCHQFSHCLALFMQPHSTGGTWIPFRLSRKQRDGVSSTLQGRALRSD